MYIFLSIITSLLVLNNDQGAKLRNTIGFPFGNQPLKIGFPKLFETFQMETTNLNIDFYNWCPVGNPYPEIGFPTVFFGVPETRKLSNFTS